MKSTFTNWNWKNITLFTVSVATGLTAIIMIWRLTIEPFYTNQLTTLTWFGAMVLVSCIYGSIASWLAFWND